MENIVVSTCFNPACKHQAINQVIKHGKDRQNRQRYKCKHCKKTFIEIEKPPRKQVQKGVKGQRGRSELYDEVKGKMAFSLTQTALRGLDQLAIEHGVSRSEFVERIGRGIIPILKPKKTR